MKYHSPPDAVSCHAAEDRSLSVLAVTPCLSAIVASNLPAPDPSPILRASCGAPAGAV